MINKIPIMLRTIGFQKPSQIFWRIYLIINRSFSVRKKKKRWMGKQLPQLEVISIDKSKINKKLKIFSENIDFVSMNWDVKSKPKIWRYHLHYFDYLENCDKETGQKIIVDWIEKNPLGRSDGWEPYPISLRVVNWIKFFSRHQIEPDDQIVQSLFVQKNVLFKYRELHLLANHFFKNIAALLYLSVFFQDEKLYNWSIKHLKKEIREQSTNAGLHYEFSPTYHALFVKDLLDVYSILKMPLFSSGNQLYQMLENKIYSGLFWVNYFAEGKKYYRIGDVNFEGCPSKAYLNQYASELGISSDSEINEQQCFPRLVNNELKIMLLNAPFNPPYNSAHSHCDKLSVLAWYKDIPLFVDTGNHNYEKTPERQYTRSVQAHNTIQIDNLQQAEIWDVFRVGRRGDIIDTNISSNEMTGIFSYRKYKHKRKISLVQDGFLIADDVIFSGVHHYKVFFHVNPDLHFNLVGSEIHFDLSHVRMVLPKGKVTVVKTDYYPEMYIKRDKKTIIINGEFTDRIRLETIIRK
ncbi:MAG TPA: hypothetical protein DHW42_02680 [Candidatus Marinimicrobia bacterium]|nr:hypothetical protein [Candidatus Neomarinimicrobiota bacterium]